MIDSVSASAPGKLILFGEWAVLQGHACVGLPLDGTFVTRARPAETNVVTSTNLDLPESEPLLKNNSWIKRVWAQLEHHLPIPNTYHYECHRSWSLHEGLGSSSALFLTLTEIRETILGKNLSWPELKMLFSDIHKNRGSGMDLAIQRSRSAIVYEHFLPTKISNLRWPKNLFLLHGTRKQNTCHAIETVTCSPEQARALGQSAQRFSKSGFADRDWINAITEHFDVLQSMQVIPSEALELLAQLKSVAQITALKSVGAGGMDGLLVWSENPTAFAKYAPELNELGWYLSPHKAVK